MCHNKGEFLSPFLWFTTWSWAGVELVILGRKAIFTDSTATPVCGPERWVYIGRRGRTREEDRLQPRPRMGPLTPYCVGNLQEGSLAVFQEMPSRSGRQTPEVFLSSQGLRSFVACGLDANSTTKSMAIHYTRLFVVGKRVLQLSFPGSLLGPEGLGAYGGTKPLTL